MTESGIPQNGETHTKPEKKKRGCRRCTLLSIWFLYFVVWFGIDTLLLRNVPLLLMVVFVAGSLYFINRLTTRRFDPPPKPRTLRMGKFILLQMAAFFGFAFVLLCVMRYCVPPVSISKKTTYLTEPRTSDGMEIDLVRAVDERMAPQGDPKDNGFREVVRLFGMERVFDFEPKRRNDYSARFLERLKLSKNERPALKSQDIYEFFETKIRRQELPPEEKTDVAVRGKTRALVKQLTQAPWKTEDVQDAETWLRENDAALDRFGEAVRMPSYYVPPLPLPYYDPMENSVAYEGGFHRSMVRSLQCRIMHALAAANVEQAIYDTETLLRLGASSIPRPVSSSQWLVSLAVQGVGLLVVRQIVEFGNPTKEQIERLREIVRRNNVSVDLQNLVFLFRMEGLAGLYYAATGRLFDSDDPGEKPSAWRREERAFMLAAWRYFAWNTAFARYQQKMDRLDRIVRSKPSRVQMEAVRRWSDEPVMYDTVRDNPLSSAFLKYVFTKGLYQVVPDAIGSVFVELSNSRRPDLFQSQYRGIVQQRQTDIVLALELHRIDRGVYPDSLDVLKDDLFGAVRNDPYGDGAAFRYSRIEKESKSGYILYSVGPNGVDDGGFNKREICPEFDDEDGRRDGDDILVFLLR